MPEVCGNSVDDDCDGEVDDPVVCVISTEELQSLVSCLSSVLSELESHVLSLYLDGHSYEATARDRLTVQKADLVIENGGGYDAFIDGLIEASGSDATVLTAVEMSRDVLAEELRDALNKKPDGSGIESKSKRKPKPKCWPRSWKNRKPSRPSVSALVLLLLALTVLKLSRSFSAESLVLSSDIMNITADRPLMRLSFLVIFALIRFFCGLPSASTRLCASVLTLTPEPADSELRIA